MAFSNNSNSSLITLFSKMRSFIHPAAHAANVDLLMNGLVGFELTFTNECLVDSARHNFVPVYNALYDGYLNRWTEVLLERHGDRVLVEPEELDKWGYGRIVVSIPSIGQQLQIHSDDWVFEVNNTPMTLDQLSLHSDELQAVLFDSARQVGLEPHFRVGGGHVHFDVATHFGNDYWLFRNFVVDLVNRPELFLGGLCLDLLNGPPLAIQDQEQRDAFKSILAEFDSLPDDEEEEDSNISDSENQPDAKQSSSKLPKIGAKIKAFARAIRQRVYYTSYIRKINRQMDEYAGNESKYQCINMNHIETIGTLELRGLAPQRSVAEMYAVAWLFQSRIGAIRRRYSKAHPVEYLEKSYEQFVTYEVDNDMELYHVDIDRTIIEKSLASYIKAAFVETPTKANCKKQNGQTLRRSMSCCLCSKHLKITEHQNDVCGELMMDGGNIMCNPIDGTSFN